MTPIVFQILLALADRDLHGLGIMEEVLERTGGTMRLWPAMLYRNIQKLSDEGLIAEVPSDTTMVGRARYFRLTAAGRRACAAEARRLQEFVSAARQKRLLRKP